MKTFLKYFLGLIAVLSVAYIAGPKPPKPTFSPQKLDLPNAFSDLEKQISDSESAVKGLKTDNQARIVWADSSKKQKTKIALLYLHGFSASQKEGDPVHKNLAKKYGANLYLARLSEHGIDLGDSTMAHFNAEDYEESAEKALEIAKKLGDEVIIIGTSAGGAMTAFLASRHPEIKAIVLYSPCIKIYDNTAEMLDNPWGLQIAHLVRKSDFNDIKPKNEIQPKYWTMHYRLEAVVGLQNFLTNTMSDETFAKVKCPVYLAYFYKNEEEQDKVVSVPALLNMFEKLGTPADLKQKMAFPKTGNHVIASYVMSDDWQGVQDGTDKFLKEIVKL
jgi:esterase/lipase